VHGDAVEISFSIMSTAERFFRGVASLGRGAQLAFGDRALRRWVLMPFFLAVALVAALIVFGIVYAVRRDIGHNAFSVIVGAIAFSVVAYFGALFFAIAPFAGVLSARAETLALGAAPLAVPLRHAVAEAARGLGHTLLGFTLYVTTSLMLVVAHVFLPMLAPLIWIAGLLQTALFVAYDFFDPTLSRRVRGFGDKWRYIAAHRAEALGFGAATAILLAIPIVGLLVPPVAVVAATLLVIEE
jgi:uncharacterized protein involved in cysteine biosynthesis